MTPSHGDWRKKMTGIEGSGGAQDIGLKTTFVMRKDRRGSVVFFRGGAGVFIMVMGRDLIIDDRGGNMNYLH